MIRRFFAVAGVALTLAPAAYANVPAESRPRPELQATRLATAPELDGRVTGDIGWQPIEPTSGFTQVQPSEGAPASQRTDVYVGYTDTALYIGFVAYDENPETIIVTDSRRDSALDQTDSFQVVIDGLLDRQNAYLFGTNPAGVEYDAQIIREGSGFNVNWDGSWRVASRITDVGWSGEMEIPFSTLRYGVADVQSWGINFQRNRLIQNVLCRLIHIL